MANEEQKAEQCKRCKGMFNHCTQVKVDGVWKNLCKHCRDDIPENDKVTLSDVTKNSHQAEHQVTVDCEYCDRSESFDLKETARAWLSGHIQEEHSDKLPSFSNGDCDRSWCDGPEAELEPGAAFGGLCSDCFTKKKEFEYFDERDETEADTIEEFHKMKPNDLSLNPRSHIEAYPKCPLCDEHIYEVSGDAENKFECGCEEVVKFTIPVE